MLIRSIFRYLKEWAKTIYRAIITHFKTSTGKTMEIISLRRQLAQFQHEVECGKRPKPRVSTAFRHLYVLLYKFWPNWKNCLAIVKPETVVKWHRNFYRFIWKFISKKNGRPKISRDVYEQTKEVVEKNPGTSSEKIHDIMVNLGITDAPAPNTIRKYFPSTRKPPGNKKIEATPKQLQSWKTFLHNQREFSWSMDFFTIPTLTFRILYGLVIINHKNRKIEHFAVTTNPDAEWTKQQIRNATPYEHKPKYLIHDNDNIFTAKNVQDFLAASDIKPVKTAIMAPWQNPYAERVIGTIRQELLNYIIPLNEKHLNRLLKEYVDYYNHHRPHQSLNSDTPVPSPK